ncbi:HAD family hydrolase [Candidatus Contubernalis alkaliaceticus]|uniref:HAD family hydrolase n=1 Tax=Candidatus Contubernalis alkaliaceticus TaxID=338645 RepID=UPI001F4C3527|nr:HAD family hydrolase [Candidatus Contubernalis alkalaceticus]UNC93616.1 HAD family hydrolase [Candidatus Contubernalis alkalaceticus]
MIKAVVFDLDDTLYPEMDFVRSGFSKVSQYLSSLFQISKEALEKEIWEQFHKDSSRVFNGILERYGKSSPELVQQLIQLYRTHEPSLTLPTQSQEILDWIREQGLKTGIITDGYLAAQKGKVKALGLEKLVDNIICTDSLGREHWKPSPLAFEIMLSQLDCAPKASIYVGDNPKKDFIPGNQLGMVTVQLISRQGVYREAICSKEQDKARYVINRLSQLKPLLKMMRGYKNGSIK